MKEKYYYDTKTTPNNTRCPGRHVASFRCLVRCTIPRHIRLAESIRLMMEGLKRRTAVAMGPYSAGCGRLWSVVDGYGFQVREEGAVDGAEDATFSIRQAVLSARRLEVLAGRPWDLPNRGSQMGTAVDVVDGVNKAIPVPA